MSILKEKSEFNTEGAQVLYDNNLYAPSVHCSYYAFLQRLKYNLKILKGTSYADIETECLKSRFGSHGYLINECFLIYQQKADHRDYKSFKRKVNDLKAFREEADYFNIEIRPEKSLDCIDRSAYLIREINDKMKK